jgi:DNA polymerase V
MEFEQGNLNDLLIKHPVSTFYGRVKGQSMRDAGIDDGDLLMIDKALPHRHDSLAVCCLNGEFTLKRIKREKDKLWLMPANPEFQPIEVKVDDEFTIWGIVAWVVKKTY